MVDTDFDTKFETRRLQLRDPYPPFRNIIRNTACRADGHLKRSQEVGAIRKVAGTIVLRQGLVDGQSGPGADIRRGEQTTRHGTKARDQDMLGDVVISPPTIGSHNFPRRGRTRQ